MSFDDSVEILFELSIETSVHSASTEDSMELSGKKRFFRVVN